MKLETEGKSIIKRCSDTEITNLTVTVMELDDDSYDLKVKGVADDDAFLTLMETCIEALQEQFEYSKTELMSVLMSMLEDYYDEED